MDAGNLAWLLVSAALVLFMTPGLAFFYGGMDRRRSRGGRNTEGKQHRGGNDPVGHPQRAIHDLGEEPDDKKDGETVFHDDLPACRGEIYTDLVGNRFII